MFRRIVVLGTPRGPSILSVFALALGLSRSAHAAAAQAYEPFNYPAGNATPLIGGTGWGA